MDSGSFAGRDSAGRRKSFGGLNRGKRGASGIL